MKDNLWYEFYLLIHQLMLIFVATLLSYYDCSEQ